MWPHEWGKPTLPVWIKKIRKNIELKWKMPGKSLRLFILTSIYTYSEEYARECMLCLLNEEFLMRKNNLQREKLKLEVEKLFFGFWSLISATLNFFSSLQFCKKDACGSPKGTDQQNSVLWSVEGRKNSLVSSQTEKLRFWVFSDFLSGIGGQFQSFLTPWKSIMVVKVTKSLHSQLIKRVQ